MDGTSGRFVDGEPDFDAPPRFDDDGERRMHVRAFEYWSSLLRGRAFPAPSDMDACGHHDFGPSSVLLDFTADRKCNPELRFIGTRLKEECGSDCMGEEVRFDDLPRNSLLWRLTDHYMQIFANRAPIGFEAEFPTDRGALMMYRGILMPLSTDGFTIDHIYGVLNWKALLAPEEEKAICREAGLV